LSGAERRQTLPEAWFNEVTSWMSGWESLWWHALKAPFTLIGPPPGHGNGNGPGPVETTMRDSQGRFWQWRQEDDEHYGGWERVYAAALLDHVLTAWDPGSASEGLVDADTVTDEDRARLFPERRNGDR
jgi:hypothetical protein